MKTLKITLIIAVLLVSVTSCVKQDLNEDDLLQEPKTNNVVTFTGGHGQD